MFYDLNSSNIGASPGAAWQPVAKTAETAAKINTYDGTVQPGVKDAPRKRQEGTGKVAERTAPAEKTVPRAVAGEQARTEPGHAEARRDQAELRLALSREERDAIVGLFEGGESAKNLSAAEKETAKNAADRITRHIDEVLAKNSESRGKVEKALTEWYTKVTNGEHTGPTELLDLLRKAAMGAFDEISM